MKKFLFFIFIFIFTISIIGQSSGSIKIIKVKINGTPGIDCNFAGNRAIEDAIESINDASENKRYEILIYPGTYKALDTSEFNSAGSFPGNYAFIRGRDYISIKGTDKNKVIIEGELLDNLGKDFSYSSYSTLFWDADHANIEDLTIIAKNLRYPIHMDGSRLGMEYVHDKFKNLKLIHLGNSKDALNWKSYHPLGIGMSDGQVLEVDSSYFQSTTWPLYVHNNKNFTKRSKLIFKDCTFVGLGNKKLLAMFQNLGSQKSDEIIINNCNWSQGYIMQADDWPYLPTSLENQSYNHCNFKVKGFGNSPFLWESSFKGEALKITSKSTGGTVRFDPNCSAFPLIVKDNNYKIGKFIKYNGEISEKGYSYRDGFGNIKGYAIGHLDVGDEPTYDGTYIKSLGKRLGNCSGRPKILVVIVDGKKYKIIFDKNYAGAGLHNPWAQSDYTNNQIIDQMNNVLGSVADVSLYAVGNDYYPEFSDYLDTLQASENILKGMVVIKDPSGKIRIATKNDKKIFGVSLDDIIEDRMGRVLKKGYITVDQHQRFNVLLETNIPIKIGDRLGISHIPGMLSKSASLKFFTAISDNALAFNLK